MLHRLVPRLYRLSCSIVSSSRVIVLRYRPASRVRVPNLALVPLNSGSWAPYHRKTGPVLEPVVLHSGPCSAWEIYEHIIWNPRRDQFGELLSCLLACQPLSPRVIFEPLRLPPPTRPCKPLSWLTAAVATTIETAPGVAHTVALVVTLVGNPGVTLVIVPNGDLATSPAVVVDLDLAPTVSPAVTDVIGTHTGDKGPNTHWAHCEHIVITVNM